MKKTKNNTKPLSDMHSGGVYFDEEVKKELQKKREDETCQYSGLPSVRSYGNQDQEPHIGHA